MGAKDIKAKEYLSDNTRFADLCNYYLFEGKNMIRPENLVAQDTTELLSVFGTTKKELQVEKWRDILKQAVIKKTDSCVYAIIGVENQTDIHYAMPVRCMIYDALNYGKQVNEAAKKHKKKKDFANKFAKQMSVKMVDVNQFVSNLSGGNKQKVVLARWIGKDSDIVVLDSPTRGIDIKVKQDIYQLMNQMRKNGKSIIMISEELMELIGMCDRIMIMKDGKISGELERDQNLDENGLITMMV